MALVVEQDTAFDPVDVGFFDADGVLFDLQSVADLIEGPIGFFMCLLRAVIFHSG